MTQIIAPQIAQINSYLPVVGSVTTRKLNSLPKKQFLSIKAEQHKEADRLIDKHKYKTLTAAILHKLINCINAHGVSRISRETLALEFKCSVRTIGRHLDKLEDDGVIFRKKLGWKCSNATAVLFVQHWLSHKEDKMSHNLTPHDSLRGNHHEGGLRKPKKATPLAFAYACQAPEEPELTDEQKAHGTEQLRLLREMLQKGVN